MADAYDKLANAGSGQFGGIGASATSPTARAIARRLPAFTPAFQNEVQRQNFENARATLAAEISRARNKGLGSRSNVEHVMATADLPSIESDDPQTARLAFGRLNADIARAEALDKEIGVRQGKQPEAAPPPEGSTATNPQTGARMIFRTGRWVPLR